MKKIINAYTTGLQVPSARFRIRQLIEELKIYDLYIKEFPASPSSYAPKGLLNRIFWINKLIYNRINSLRLSSDSDLIIFQKELISTLPTFEIFFANKSIFDVDDAIWLNKFGLSSRIIARNVKAVVVANRFLADYFQQYNNNIHIIPTAVDTNKFIPQKRILTREKFVVGWSGTSGGYKFFSQKIQKQINDFIAGHQGSVLRITSDAPPSFRWINNKFVEYIPWTEEN
jgi:hypothetical protein